MSPVKIIVATIVGLLALLLLFVAFDIAFGVLLFQLARLTGIEALGGISSVWVLILAAILLPRNWKCLPIRYRCHGSVFVNASPGAVWDAVCLRARHDSYHAAAERIVPVAGSADEFQFHLHPSFGDEDSPVPVLNVRQVEAVPGRYLKSVNLNAGDFQMFSQDVESSEIFIEPRDGGCEVTFCENLARLSLTAIPALLYLNPARDEAKRLKAWVEGEPDTSRMTQWMRDMEAEGRSPELARDFHIAAITACVVLALFALGLLFGLTQMNAA